MDQVQQCHVYEYLAVQIICVSQCGDSMLFEMPALLTRSRPTWQKVFPVNSSHVRWHHRTCVRVEAMLGSQA